MIGTVALFITIFLLLCLFALIFVCYRAGSDSRRQQQQQEAEAAIAQRATIILISDPSTVDRTSNSIQRPRLGTRKRPTPPTIIRNLPVMVWDKPNAAGRSSKVILDSASTALGKDIKGSSADDAGSTGSQEQESLCVICCCEYEKGERVKLLPCLHMYHEACIEAWLGRSHACPVCQADVIQAAGLSAALAELSTHNRQPHSSAADVQQQPPTATLQQHDSSMQRSEADQHRHQCQQQQSSRVACPAGSQHHVVDVQGDRVLTGPPLSSPTLSPVGAATLLAAAPHAAAPAIAVKQGDVGISGSSAQSLHSTDGLAFVSTHAAGPSTPTIRPASHAALQQSR